MATNVEIIIKGLALWFQKENFWNALLYFDDDCHLVDFSHGPADRPPVLKRSLARPNGKIRMDIEGSAITAPTSTAAFDARVLNLTAREGTALPYLTHHNVRTRDNYRAKAIYLRLGNAELSVLDYLEELTDDPILLHGENIKLQRLGSLGHWVRAKIRVPEGSALVIRIHNEANPIRIPGTAGETSHRITINNDCSKKSLNNDMFRYYDFIIGSDFEDREEKFWVGKRVDQSLEAIIQQRLQAGTIQQQLQAMTEEVDVSKFDISILIRLLLFIIFTGGAALLQEGKPCMSLQATESGGLPNFP